MARSSKGKAGGQGGRGGGGGKQRSYARDNKGRFSSTGATARGGRLATASGNKRETQTKRIAGGGSGVISANRKPSAKTVTAPSIGANNVRRLSKSNTGHSRALRANAIRSYKPQTPQGKMAQTVRQIQSAAGKPDTSLKGRVRKVLGESDKLMNRMHRQHARHVANRFDRGINGRLSGIYRSASNGGLNRGASSVIQARAARAAAAAARGSAPAARAQQIYANQLAFTGKGKPSKGSNNIQPGRGNTRPPKPRRRRK